MGFIQLLNLSLYIMLATNTVFCVNNNSEIFYRLPNNTVPVFYNIFLVMNLEEGNFTFHGETNVKIEIRHTSLNNISFHSKELEINKTATTLINGNNIVYKPIEHFHDNVTDILTLNFENAISPGFYTLNMRFTGIISENSFYNSGFMTFPYEIEGKESIIVATYSEPKGARQIFPCWDEPALKANFNISVMHHANYRVFSNMPQVKQESFEYDMRRTYFNTSPIMSTYLLEIIVIPAGYDFHYLSNSEETINVWYRSSLRTQIQFMYDIIEKVTPFLIQYTNISEKVPKMDNFLIPDYPIDGMEHWGLITYSESVVLYNDEKDLSHKKVKVATIATHEIVHQWFGNLVTPSWWSYLWLKEGLTSFLHTYIIDKIFTDWRTMDFFVIQTLHNCLFLDNGALGPVTLELDSTFDKEDLISFVVYNKAPVLMRMLQHIITKEVFQKGLIKYLATHEYGSTVPDDLWSAMQSALDESYIPHDNYRIKEVMDTWMNQDGYPEIKVIKNYTTGEVTISQECAYNAEINSKWWIPISIASQSNPDFANTMPRFWLRPDQNITFPTNPNDWIIINVQQTGYYRVNYDIENWEKLSNYLNSNSYENIDVLNRVQIIYDLFDFVDGRISGYVFINLIQYLSQEVDCVAWYPLLFRIMPLWKILFHLPLATYVKVTVTSLLNNLLQNIGYLNDIDNDRITNMTRLEAIKWACTLGDEFCKNTTAVKLNQHLADPELYKIPFEQNFMYCIGMMAANRTTWNKMLELYQKTDSKKRNLKETLLSSLSCAEDPYIIINYLNIAAFNNSLFQEKSNYSLIFKSIVNKHLNKDLILDYILNNFETIKPRFLNTMAIIRLILQNVYNEDQIDKIKKFSDVNFNHNSDTWNATKILIRKRENALQKMLDTFKKLFF